MATNTPLEPGVVYVTSTFVGSHGHALDHHNYALHLFSPPGIRASNQSAAKACCVACNTHFGIDQGGRHDVKRHIERAPGSDRERAAHIAKAQSCLGSINRFVAAGCEIDKVTYAEIAFAIFIAKHNLPMAVGDEFGLVAKKMFAD